MTKIYVSMTDKFFSGWGMAQGKVNKYVIECDNYEQARIIVKNAKLRPEMKYINIVHRIPNQTHYVVSLVHYDDLGDIWKKQ